MRFPSSGSQAHRLLHPEKYLLAHDRAVEQVALMEGLADLEVFKSEIG